MLREVSAAEFGVEKSRCLFPDFCRSLEVDFHRRDGCRILDPGRDLGGPQERYLSTWASGERRLNLRTEEVVREGLGFFGMRSALGNREGVWQEECAQSSRLSIGVDDHDRTAGID